MKQSLKYSLILGLPILVLAGFIVLLNHLEKNGNEVKIPSKTGLAAGCDFCGLLSSNNKEKEAKELTINLDWNKTDCTQFANKKCPNNKGYNEFSFKLPKDKNIRKFFYQVTTITQHKDSEAWNNKLKNIKVEAVFSANKHFPLLAKYILIDGISVQKWYENHKNDDAFKGDK